MPTTDSTSAGSASDPDDDGTTGTVGADDDATGIRGGADDDGTTGTAGADGDRADEYRHLRVKRRECAGNEATARVRDVDVGRGSVRITAGFEPGDAGLALRYDLEDDRDVLQLEALAEASGLAFEQVGHLDGMDVDLRYTGERWVPVAHLDCVEGEASPRETLRTELRLLARELARTPRFLRGGIDRVRGLSGRDLLIGVVAAKKVLVVALLVWMVL